MNHLDQRVVPQKTRVACAPTHGDETGQGRAKSLDAIEPPMELFVRRHTRLVPLKVFPHGGQFPPNGRVQILDHRADGARPTQILGNFQGIGGQSAEFRLQFDTGLYGRCRRCRLLARFRWVYLLRNGGLLNGSGFEQILRQFRNERSFLSFGGRILFPPPLQEVGDR